MSEILSEREKRRSQGEREEEKGCMFRDKKGRRKEKRNFACCKISLNMYDLKSIFQEHWEPKCQRTFSKSKEH